MAPSARVTPHSVGRCRIATEGSGRVSGPAKRVGERLCQDSPSGASRHLPPRGRLSAVPLRHIREHIPCTEQPLVIIHLKMAVVPEGVAGIAHIAYDLPLLHHVAYVHRLG